MKSENSESRRSDAADALEKPVPNLRRIASDDLFQGQSAIIIEHAGSECDLRITRQGKLILTK